MARASFGRTGRSIDEQARRCCRPDARALLARLVPGLDVDRLDRGATEAVVRAFAEGPGVKLGAVAQPLRAALTGRTTSPRIFDVLAVLGRDESLARLQDQAAAGTPSDFCSRSKTDAPPL